MIKKSLFLLTLITLIFATFAFFANAQVKSDDVSLAIIPKQPSSNETVRATISSYSVDLNKTFVSWILDGQTVSQGVGQKNFSFKTGDTGFQTVLDVKIETIDGTLINKQKVINPASIDILWEAPDSYVPPFYKGKALIPSEGTVKVVTLLNSDQSASASYNWELDGKVKAESSGFGKNAYVFKKTYLDKTNEIKVGVSSLLGDSLGNGTIEIGNSNPKILFYEKDPLLGTLWEETLKDNFTIKPEGETIVVEPYFVSPKDLSSPSLHINWELGSSVISAPNIKNELSIKPESSGGTSVIKVNVENVAKMFLNISKEINVKF